MNPPDVLFHYWQDRLPCVSFVVWSSILQWQESTNAAGCEYRNWIMWLHQMCSLHNLFISIFSIFLCTVGQFQSDFLNETSFHAQIARRQQFMPISASGPAVVWALGFKCISCDAEFASRRAADCHCRCPTYSGTACADSKNIRSLSLTERPDVSVGILRQHSAAPLGAWM